MASYHVKFHQDKNIPFDQLTRPTQLNVLADQIAKQEWKNQRLKGIMKKT